MSAPDRTRPAAGPAVPWERIERFVGQMTHDLRNGLNALELQLTYLGEICPDPEAAEEVKRLRSSLADITRQLQALKVATGPVSCQLIEYPAEDFFEDLRERFERTNPGGAPRVAWEIAASGATLAADVELSLAALLELLNNAMHFGGPAGSATMAAHAAGSGVRITLREAGVPGRAPLETARWGLEPLQSTRRAGYGLGLFRVRRIIEAQGGTFSAEDNPSAAVLTTTVVLPAAADSAAVAPRAISQA